MRGANKSCKPGIMSARPPVTETLERRMLLSAGHAAMKSDPDEMIADPGIDALPGGSSSPYGLAPATLRQAYGMNVTNFGGVAGDGTGMTIAIVDNGNAPNITSDLAAFDSYYGLAAPPSLSVVNQTGGTSLPATASSAWGLEISMDVEWAHVMAPNASIDLVETNTANLSDLYTGVDTARNLPNVCVVSMSWSVSEYSGDSSDDYHFTTPAGHTGVTFVASTGDYGAYYPDYQFMIPQYPASSPNVLSVGATTLTTNSGAYVSESGWGNGTNSYTAGGSGGGISNDTSQPSWQNGVVTQSTTQRCTPDVSIDGDPNTGASIYDSYDNGSSTPWLQYGGTSLSTPMWAAIIAVADQGRLHNGLQKLDGATQTLPMLYSLPSSDFHDVTTGNNGYAAGPGYDLVTGLGTPIVNLLAPALAGSSSLTSTTTAVASSKQSSTYGQSVTFTATVTPSSGSGETGTVQFQIDGTNVGSAVNISGGAATYTTSTLGFGSHSIVAIYSGDSGFAGSTSASFTQNVAKDALAITANADSKTYGQIKTYGAGSTAFTSSGLQNNDTIGSVTITASGGTSANAGVGSYSLTPSSATGGTFNASDYSITYHSGVLTDSAATLSITANADSKTYGQTKSYGGGSTAFTSSGLQNSETIGSITITANGGTSANAGVGSYTLTPSAAVGGTFNASDYSITYNRSVLTVSAATLSISANADSKTYGQTKSYGAGSTAFTSSGLQNSETIGSITITASGGTAANASVGTYTLTPSAAIGGTFNASDYSITYRSATLTVNQAVLIVTATGVNKVYDGGTVATVTLSDNRLNGDSITDSYSAAVFANANAGTGKTVSVSGISISGSNAEDYTLQNTTASTTANITQSTTTTVVRSSNSASTYGQAITFTATVTPASGSGETGSVQFQIDGSNVGTAMNVSGGTATFTTSTLAGGSHSVVAVYSGDGNFTTSTSSAFMQTIRAPLELIGTNYLELDATTAGQLDVWAGISNIGTATASYQLSQVSSITDDGSGGNDTLSIDFTNGNPLAAVTPGVSFLNTSNTDRLLIVGDAHGDSYSGSTGAIAVSGGGSAFTGVPITFGNGVSESIQGGSGPDTLVVSGGTTVIYTAPAGGAYPTANLSSLSIGSGSKVVFASPSAGNALLQLSSVATWAGQLDLQSNDMLIHGGASAFNSIDALVASGFQQGSWTGQGITSSSAASNASHLTVLGTILNNQNGSAVFNSSHLFDGVAPAATDVLVKYSYYGDADLAGSVTSADYALIDAGYLSQGGSTPLTGWQNGDFNYDGVINGSDYTLIDNAFNLQGQALSSISASPGFSQTARIGSELAAAPGHSSPLAGKSQKRWSTGMSAALFQSKMPIVFALPTDQSIEFSLQSKDVLDRLSMSEKAVSLSLSP